MHHSTYCQTSDALNMLCLMQPFNVLRYQHGQHYDSHYDVFEPESYGPQTSQRVCARLCKSSEQQDMS